MTAAHRASALGRAGSHPWLPLPGLRAAVAGFAILVAICAVLAVRETAMWAWGTTYGGAAPEAAFADFAAGLGLIAVGMFVGADRGTRHLGNVLMLAGAAWFAADIVGWQGASMHLRMLALAGALMIGPLLLYVVAVAPGRRPLTRGLRFAIGGSYVVTALLGLALLFIYDPVADEGCWAVCASSPFILPSAPTGLAERLQGASILLGSAMGAVVAVIAAWRLAGAAGPRRRSLWPILVPGVVVGVSLAMRWLSPVVRGADGPSDIAAMALFQLSAWAVACFAAGIALVTRSDRRTRAAIQALGLGDEQGGIRSATSVLVEATSDPSLRVAYPRADGTGFVDASGSPVDASVGDGRSLTTVTRAGTVVALIDHDPDALTPMDLADLLGPAARLALENERLDAELLAQVQDLRASRTRIVAAADRERRRRERDLHDGAQQRLLALTYELRNASALAERSGEKPVAEHLEAAIAAVHAAHAELREVAHGIYPAILAEAGLSRALETLVDRSPIPLRTDADDATLCSIAAEMTAYTVADELVRDAAGRGATRARIRVAGEAGRLVMEFHDDGRSPVTALVHCEDRAGAAGGSLTLVSSTTGDVLVRLEVPCASS